MVWLCREIAAARVDEPECGRRDEQGIFPGAPTYYQRKGDECPYRVVCVLQVRYNCVLNNKSRCERKGTGTWEKRDQGTMC